MDGTASIISAAAAAAVTVAAMINTYENHMHKATIARARLRKRVLHSDTKANVVPFVNLDAWQQNLKLKVLL